MREHLRKTMTFFLALSADQGHVPFAHAGTGTINTLVLVLLSFIADLKPETVIFAMEEPEIAVPPIHSGACRIPTDQDDAGIRDIALALCDRKVRAIENTAARTQCRCRHGSEGLRCHRPKDNDYKRFSRSGLSECMLGPAAIVVEGVTELHAMPVVARRMEENDPTLQPLDIAGVAFFDADGESNMPKFGKFFNTLGLRSFALRRPRLQEDAQA